MADAPVLLGDGGQQSDDLVLAYLQQFVQGNSAILPAAPRHYNWHAHHHSPAQPSARHRGSASPLVLYPRSSSQSSHRTGTEKNRGGSNSIDGHDIGGSGRGSSA